MRNNTMIFRDDALMIDEEKTWASVGTNPTFMACNTFKVQQILQCDSLIAETSSVHKQILKFQ